MKKRASRALIVIVALLIILALAIGVGVIWLAYFSSPLTEGDELLFEAAKNTTITEYYTNAGKDNSLEYYEPRLTTSAALGDTRKNWVMLSDAGDALVKAIISAEDREFYRHRGINVPRTLYALANEIFHFKSKFGASTVTQQVIKNISGDSELTVKRKLLEIVRAYNMEKRHSKDEILELYINIIPLGEGIVGARSGAEIYFGKEPRELTLAEAATLVGITNAPTRYNPHRHPEKCLEKRNSVLAAMLDNEDISRDEYSAAVEAPLGVLPHCDAGGGVLSWFIETVNADVLVDLCEKYGMSEAAASALLSSGGLKIYTTESPELQRAAEKYFAYSANFPQAINDGLEYSFVICDSKSGDLLAIIGSADAKHGNLLMNHATVPHIPGSVLKPLALYAPLIDSGMIDPATVFDDVPISFTPVGDGYREYPHNYPNVYSGLITVKDALRLSKNTVAVRLYKMLGGERIYRILRENYGFDTVIRGQFSDNGSRITDIAEAPLALGQLSYGIPLRSLTEAYTVFPSEGVVHRRRSYVAVYDSSGKLLLHNEGDGKRVLSREGARVMNQLLMSVTANGTASRIKLKYSIDTAGKTGTSGDDKDRLFIGYTPYLTAGIWCGYPNGGRAVGNTGKSHIVIWDEIMQIAHTLVLRGAGDSEIESFSVDGLVRREFCRDSGQLYSDSCAFDVRGGRADSAYFKGDSFPNSPCTRHVICELCDISGKLALKGCPSEGGRLISLIKVNGRSFPKEIYVADADYVYHGPPISDMEKYDQKDNVTYSGIGQSGVAYNEYCEKHRRGLLFYR